MEDPTDEDNLATDEVVVGKTSGSGVKITHVSFDFDSILSLQDDGVIIFFVYLLFLLIFEPLLMTQCGYFLL